jgi:hypothetical protein
VHDRDANCRPGAAAHERNAQSFEDKGPEDLAAARAHALEDADLLGFLQHQYDHDRRDGKGRRH